MTDTEIVAAEIRAAEVPMSDALGAALDRLQRDADRYRWLCGNNFDREGTTQVHTWLRTWELHSQTGQPIEWTQRVRGSTLDSVIDAAMVADAAGAA